MTQFIPIQVANPNILGNFQGGQQIRSQFDQGRQAKKVSALEFQDAADKARISSVIQGAVQLKQITDPNEKLTFLRNRKQQLIQAGIPTNDTDEALLLAEAGDFEGLERETDLAIQLGQSLNAKQQTPGAGQFTLGSQRFSPQGEVIATGATPVEPVSPLDQARIDKLKAETQTIETPAVKLSPVQQKIVAEGLDPNSPEGRQRARELNQRSGTDPTRAPTKQEVLNKATEGQLASASFATRVGAANDTLLTLEGKEGFDPTSLQATLLSVVPGGNIALTEDQQVYQRAREDVITAILRKESGAAIGVDEFQKEDKKLFPQLGDKPAVLKQKQKARDRAFQNLRKQSKGVYEAQLDDVTTDKKVTTKNGQDADKRTPSPISGVKFLGFE